MATESQKLNEILDWIRTDQCPKGFNATSMQGIYHNYMRFRTLTNRQKEAINRVYVSYRIAEKKRF